jgi:hypothetical protein
LSEELPVNMVLPSDSSTRFADAGRNGTNQSRHADSGRRASMLRGLLHAGDAEQTAAFLTEAAPVERILLALGEPTEPPPIAPARGPPASDDAPEPVPDWDLLGRPEPDFEFDQRVSW